MDAAITRRLPKPQPNVNSSSKSFAAGPLKGFRWSNWP